MRLSWKTTKPACAICAAPMRLKAVIPSAWTCPELKTFQCDGCGDRRTVEDEAELAVTEAVRSAA